MHIHVGRQIHDFAVGDADRARADWEAIDQALLIGHMAVSPVGGLELVHAISQLSAKTIAVSAQAGRRTVVRTGPAEALAFA